MIVFLSRLLIKLSPILKSVQVNKSSFAIMDRDQMLKSMTLCLPSFDGQSHKGQAGRIGVFGGSLEYTGAPYFAGISALKVGADLVHVFCVNSAASVIKSYSPELIVHPILDRPDAVLEIKRWLERLHSIVIGPGLGRDDKILNDVADLIEIIKNKKIPLVIDADGLHLITENIDLLKDFESPVILTPNKIEYERLVLKLGDSSKLKNLNENILILKKGQTDELISRINEIQWSLNTGGSGRRCGGQGDILSGSIAIFLYWALLNKSNINLGVNKTQTAASLSCFSASCLVRLCNEKAFKIHGRSMLASDMITFIHLTFEELFGK